MDDIELGFFDEFCERARQDGCDINMAVALIFEMNAALTEGRPINPSHKGLLAQFLALHDVLHVQSIEWFPKEK